MAFRYDSVPGRCRRAKVKARIAGLHRRVADRRKDWVEKATTGLAATYAVIAVEDLNVSGMIRNRSLARAISCTGWAEFRSMLEYKAGRYGRTVVAVDRWHPSSKTCSACGHLLAALSLGTRRWACPACGTRHDRDINAAKNILAAGLAVTACGGDVRRTGTTRAQSPAKQEPLGASPGIPFH